MIEINSIEIKRYENKMVIGCELEDAQGEQDGEYEVTLPLPYVHGSLLNTAMRLELWEYEEHRVDDETYDEIFKIAKKIKMD